MQSIAFAVFGISHQSYDYVPSHNVEYICSPDCTTLLYVHVYFCVYSIMFSRHVCEVMGFSDFRVYKDIARCVLSSFCNSICTVWDSLMPFIKKLLLISFDCFLTFYNAVAMT